MGEKFVARAAKMFRSPTDLEDLCSTPLSQLCCRRWVLFCCSFVLLKLSIQTRRNALQRTSCDSSRSCSGFPAAGDYSCRISLLGEEEEEDGIPRGRLDVYPITSELVKHVKGLISG